MRIEQQLLKNIARLKNKTVESNLTEIEDMEALLHRRKLVHH